MNNINEIREHHIDNLRLIMTLLLFPYHVFMIYNTWTPFYVNGPPIPLLSAFIDITWPWFMPLFFVLSGIASTHSIERRGIKGYLKNRLLYLLAPAASGIILFAPLMSYIADIFHNGYNGSYFAHYTIFFTRWTDLTGYDGGFTPAHLWFLLYLSVFSMLLPIARALSNKITNTAKARKANHVDFWLLILMFLIPLLAQPIFDIGGKSVGEYFAFFLIGHFVLSNGKYIDSCMVHFKMLMTIFALCFSIFALHFFNILSFGFPLYDTIAELYAYSFILLMFLLFKKYVNAQNRTAKYLSRNSFGIYFFHQTWIVVFGYFTLTYIQSIPLQIALILVLSIIFTFLTVEICKRNKVLRILFGIRNV